MKNDYIITNEMRHRFDYCQECWHEWDEHSNKCTHDYCDCPWNLEKEESK